MFWCRLVIPKDLRHLYPRTASGALATTHSCVSLQTSDRAEARVRGMARRAEVEGEFLEKRRALAVPAVRPTAALQTIIADAVYAGQLAWDEGRRADRHTTVRMVSGVHSGPIDSRPDYPEVSRLAPLPASVVAQRAAFNRTRLEYVQHAIASGDLQAMIPLASQAARSLGLTVDWDSAEGAATLEACLRAHARACEVSIKRDSGVVVDTPALPEPPSDTSALKATPLHLRDALVNWEAKRRPKPDALKRTERALLLLKEAGHDKPLGKLTRPDGARLRDWLRDPARGFKQKTGQNYWLALQSLLNVATEYGQLERNPWAGLEFDVTDSKGRAEFTAEQLTALFGSTLYTAGAYRPIYKVQPWDAYYVMLLGLWTGSRIGELGQLEVADVLTENRVALVSIHEDAEGSTIKNPEAGIRKVPIAPEVLRLGLMDFVRDRQAAGDIKLFPSLHRGGKTSPGDVMGEWVRGYRKDLGLPPGPLEGFHKFRHTIRTALAAHHVGEATADALTGHAATGSTGRKVYTHVRPVTVLEALRLPLFPFLDLPRVYPTRSAS